MKTLIITPFSPYPPVFGGAIRLLHEVKMFAALSDVTLLSYRSWSEDGDSVGDLEDICQRVIVVDRPPLTGHRKQLRQARAILSRKAFQYFATYTHAFQQNLDAVTHSERFDCIVTASSQMGYFHYNHPPHLKILDLQNIEFELLQRRAQVETHPIKRRMLAAEARKVERDELAIFDRFDLVLTPSERERDLMRNICQTTCFEALPNSIDTDYFALRPDQPTANEIVFVGATHVHANHDGLLYFLNEIFPLIQSRVPNLHFTVVGGDPPADLRAWGMQPNIEVTGYVHDVRDYMARAKVLIVPLRVGGGTRLKILEGLSFGVPTVSTSIGSEGVAVKDGQHLLIADTPETFADAVVKVLEDVQLQQSLRVNGRVLAEQIYSWQAVGKQLAEILHRTRTSTELAWL